MRHFLVLVTTGVLSMAAMRAVHAGAPTVEASSVGNATCDTTYVGPAGGPHKLDLNWTSGLPGPGSVACFPDTASTVAAHGAGGSPLPPLPPPTAQGGCCLGSACLDTDFFDCRELGGHFLEDIACLGNPCTTGACCVGDPPTCVGDDGLGGDMGEALCAEQLGTYVGGGVCDETDPCQPHRIPTGFEIAEVAPGTESLRRRHPRMNDCGQIVFHMRLDSPNFLTNRVFHYDNGLLTQATDEDASHTFPDISNNGAVVWMREFEKPSDFEVLMLRDGKTVLLGQGRSPSVNNLDRAAWQRSVPEPCEGSEFESDIWLHDGISARMIFHDGLSNQSVRINDHDELAWTRFTFPCGGGFGNWTSEVMLHVAEDAVALPSSSNTPQSPHIDNSTRVAWDGSPQGLEVWEDDGTTILVQANTARPALGNEGDIAYNFKTTFTPWQVWLYRNGQFRRISGDVDIENLTDNIAPAINATGEVAWWWLPNGGITPSGIRYMRRIRNGDVNFDGVVDLADFIPMPNCFTGPVATDGLCECRFFDMDHDRDIDDDDFALFMRVYAGALEDCNDNGSDDLSDLIARTSVDCNLNGRPDSCDITDNAALDSDGDGMIDACCPGALEQPTGSILFGDGLVAVAKNRFLSFSTTDSDPQAIRVTFFDLPEPFDATSPPEPRASARAALPDGWDPRGLKPAARRARAGITQWSEVSSTSTAATGGGRYGGTASVVGSLVGASFWLGEPREITELSGIVEPAMAEGWPTFWAATLQCEPFYTDWSALGTVHIYHETIIPGGVYDLQAIKESCGIASEVNFSAPLTIGTSQYGNISGPFDEVRNVWTEPEPDGTVDIVTDVLAGIAKFANRPGAPIKTRVDLEPATIDFKINITDITQALTAFRGLPYPFVPTTTPCMPN